MLDMNAPFLYGNDENTNYLEHYGILKQKHGVRRYQNPDGTYTALGKERRRIGRKSRSKKDDVKTGTATKRNEEEQNSGNKAVTKKPVIKKDLSTEEIDTIRKRLMKSEDLDEVLEYAEHLNANELNEINRRITTINQMRETSNKAKAAKVAEKPNKDRVAQFTKSLDKATNVASSVNKLANAFGINTQELAKEFIKNTTTDMKNKQNIGTTAKAKRNNAKIKAKVMASYDPSVIIKYKDLLSAEELGTLQKKIDNYNKLKALIGG